jgi:uncharacterized protein YprB with RNaseH-like and TPR domain
VLPIGYGSGATPPEPRVLADLALVRGRAGTGPLLALDIETALGPGVAGAPFVIGLARGGPEPIVEQWLLDRADAERPMLADFASRLDALVAAGAASLSFGGTGFDLPVLCARMQRLRIRCDALAERGWHVDLLPVARRLWRRMLPDCRLATIERTVLGLVRRGDPSGAEVARIGGRWLAGVRDRGLVGELVAVQRHNRADLVSLPTLCRALAQRIGEGGTPHEALGAAQHRRVLGDVAGAIEILRALVEASPTRMDALAREAALRLATLVRAAGGHDEAIALWSRVLASEPGEPRASVALAKHLEHHALDPAAALRVALASSQPCPRRIARLVVKASGGRGRRAVEPGPTPGALAV